MTYLMTKLAVNEKFIVIDIYAEVSWFLRIFSTGYLMLFLKPANRMYYYLLRNFILLNEYWQIKRNSEN